MSEPLFGGVGPETGDLIQESICLFDIHLAEAFALVSELHPGNSQTSRPSH